jgi:DNA adenine methylase Dam
MKKWKTPLRYPGGKSRAMGKLFTDQNMPVDHITEYREPFLGGGSPAIAFTKMYPDTPVWVNDKYYNLYCFWKMLQEQGNRMFDVVNELKQQYNTQEKAKELFLRIREDINEQDDMFEIAWRMYIINKCSFSGLTESSSFSKRASDSNWSQNNIDSLPYYSKLIQHWKITNLDYSELLTNDKNTFVFLDPPYDLKKDYTLAGGDGESLYGKKGSMHKGFNHVEFADKLNQHESMMMVTYNSNENIRKLFEGWRQTEWDLTYSMNNGSKAYQEAQKDRKELLCINYETYKAGVLY